MLKRLVPKYWPMGFLVICIGAILCMSRYAVNREADKQKDAQTSSPQSSVAPNDAGKGTEKAQEAHHSPDWINMFTWPEGVTGWALLLTLLVVAWQSTETADAAKAENAQIQFMKNRERARLAIRRAESPEIGAPESILDNQRPLWVRFFVENIGLSKAFNVRASAVVDFVPDPENGVHDDGSIQDFPQIIDEGKELHRLSLAGFGIELDDVVSTSDFLSIPEKIVQQMRDGKIFLQASGLLIYEDIFGDKHRTPFRLVWKSRGDDAGGMWLTRSAWIDYSPPSS